MVNDCEVCGGTYLSCECWKAKVRLLVGRLEELDRVGKAGCRDYVTDVETLIEVLRRKGLV